MLRLTFLIPSVSAEMITEDEIRIVELQLVDMDHTVHSLFSAHHCINHG